MNRNRPRPGNGGKDQRRKRHHRNPNRSLRWASATLLAIGVLGAHGAIRRETPSCQVSITAEPDGATLIVDDVPRGSTPAVLTDLELGEHLIILRKPGFREGRFTLSLAPGQNLVQQYRLDPLTGLLLLRSDPPEAEVYVGGAFRGKTPLLLTDLPLGTHRIRFNKSGFRSKEIDVSLTDRTPRKEEITLSADTGKLLVVSHPAGAQVKLNGIFKGVTPCACDGVQEGNVTVEVTLDGYQPWKDTVRVAAGQEQKMEISLPVIPSELQVVSLPPKARIYLNNQFRGETPLTLRDLPPGTYRVRAELPGHDIQARDVLIQPASQVVEEFRLQPNVGSIYVTTEPPGAKVFLDGKEVGTTASKPDGTNRVSEALLIANVPIGRHELSVSLKQYAARPVTVTVEKDKAVSQHVKLERHFVPDYEVNTTRGIIRGVLVWVHDGNVKLEVAPGVFRVIPAAKIKTQRPLPVPEAGRP